MKKNSIQIGEVNAFMINVHDYRQIESIYNDIFQSLFELIVDQVMMETNLEDLRCIACRQTFSPPSVLPHLLPCTHYICTTCLQKSQINHQTLIVCPDDLETITIKDIKTNCSARKMLEKLVNQHTNFNQNNQLLSIQALSKHFESVLENNNKDKQDFEGLIEKVIDNEVQRLRKIQKNIQQELSSPMRMVKQWKEMVKEYLTFIRGMGPSRNKEQISKQLNYFIEQGRSIKSEMTRYQNLNYNQIANTVAVNPSVCFRNEFSLQKYLKIQESVKETVIRRSRNLSKSKTEERQKQKYEQELQRMKNSKISSYGGQSRQKSIQGNVDREFEIRVNFQREKQSSFDYHSQIKKFQEHMNKSSQIHWNQEMRHLHPLQELDSNLLYDNKLVYSSSPSKEVLEINNDELLLTENQPKKVQTEKYDFLQKWELHDSVASSSMTVEQREPFSWEKQKNSYIKKMQYAKVQEAIAESSVQLNTLELINFEVGDMDLSLYLQNWDWQNLQVVKLVKTGLTDRQFNQLLNFTLQSKVTTLVLSNNCLGEISLDALLHYTRMNSFLKNVYLSKNQINPLKGKTRHKVLLLRQQGINLYI